MKEKKTLYKVQVIERATGKVKREFSPTHERQAERVRLGIEINLNHNEYETKIVEVK